MQNSAEFEFGVTLSMTGVNMTTTPTQDPTSKGEVGNNHWLSAVATVATAASIEDSCPQVILKQHGLNSLDYRAYSTWPPVKLDI